MRECCFFCRPSWTIDGLAVTHWSDWDLSRLAAPWTSFPFTRAPIWSIFTAQRDLAFASCCCCTLAMCVPHFSSQTSSVCRVETQAVTSLYTIGQFMVWFCFVFFKSTQGFKPGQLSWWERICSTIHGQKSVIWKEISNISNNSWLVNFLIVSYLWLFVDKIQNIDSLFSKTERKQTNIGWSLRHDKNYIKNI